MCRFAVATALLFISLLWADTTNQTVAVMPFSTDSSLTPGQIAVFQQRLMSYARETQRWQMIERSQMDVILQEQGFQQTGSCEKECQVEMGKLLGADLLVVGSIARLGKQWSITANLVNVGTGALNNSALIDVKNPEELVGEPLRDMMFHLAGIVKAKPQAKRVWPWVVGGLALTGSIIGGVIWALPAKSSTPETKDLSIVDKH